MKVTISFDPTSKHDRDALRTVIDAYDKVQGKTDLQLSYERAVEANSKAIRGDDVTDEVRLLVEGAGL